MNIDIAELLDRQYESGARRAGASAARLAGLGAAICPRAYIPADKKVLR